MARALLINKRSVIQSGGPSREKVTVLIMALCGAQGDITERVEIQVSGVKTRRVRCEHSGPTIARGLQSSRAGKSAGSKFQA